MRTCIERLAFGIVVLLAVTAALVAAAGCGGGEQKPEARAGTPTSEPARNTATVAPFVPPEAPTPGPTESVPDHPFVRFVPAPLPEPVPNPMQGQISGGRWQLVVATPDGGPKTVLDTGLNVGMPYWSPDGRAILFRTFSYQEGFGNHMVYYPDSSEAPQLLAEGTWDAAWSNSGSAVALEIANKDYSAVAVWLASPDGTGTRRLEGLGDYVKLIGWVPDDSGLLVAQTTWSTERGVTRLWLVPADGGNAVQVGQQLEFPQYAHLEGLWSPDGRSLVYLAGQPAGQDVYLFDRISGRSRRLTSTGDYSGEARWLATGRFIQVGFRLIDPETGSVTGIPGVKAYQEAALSPDRRYLAVAEEPTIEGNVARAGSIVYDFESGTTRRLTDPQKGLDYLLSWTPDGQHLWVTRAIGEGGSEINKEVLLVDVATGAEKELTNGFEHAASYVVSPDGTHVLITGTRLRVASIDGTILREILPPDGLEVGWAKWSPDGSRFAYVTAPIGSTGH
jgi:Tol biopolymer transport system component